MLQIGRAIAFQGEEFVLERGRLQVTPTSAVALTPFKGVSKATKGKFASVNLRHSYFRLAGWYVDIHVPSVNINFIMQPGDIILPPRCMPEVVM